MIFGFLDYLRCWFKKKILKINVFRYDKNFNVSILKKFTGNEFNKFEY